MLDSHFYSSQHMTSMINNIVISVLNQIQFALRVLIQAGVNSDILQFALHLQIIVLSNISNKGKSPGNDSKITLQVNRIITRYNTDDINCAYFVLYIQALKNREVFQKWYQIRDLKNSVINALNVRN